MTAKKVNQPPQVKVKFKSMSAAKTIWFPVEGKYTPPSMIPGIDCITIPLDMPLDRMPVLMGSKGKCFKAITHKAQAHYIWWNKEMSTIEIWGFIEYATIAQQLVTKRIEMVISLPDEKIISRGSSLASSLASLRMMSPVNLPDSSSRAMTPINIAESATAVLFSPITLPSPLSDSVPEPVKFMEYPAVSGVQMLQFGDFPPVLID
jgi:hypothetical protein